jgi:hypothetical protein
MYGMIHKAARDMAIARLGQSEWEAMIGGCGMTGQHFITAEYYDDAMVLQLIDALGPRLGLEREDMLEEFGRHWIRYAGSSSYARLIAMAGDSFEAFVENLDRMHASIKSTMPLARMPHFSLLSADARQVRVLYESERSGLAAFVRGILLACAERFGEDVEMAERPAEDGIEFILTRRRPRQRSPLPDVA